MNVWIYWEGYEYPLIKIFRDILKNKCVEYNYNLNFVTNKNLNNYINDEIIKDNRFNNLCIAHKADYIRVALLKKYGGIWLDSDILLINNLDRYFNYLKYYDSFLLFEDKNILSNGFMGSNKDSKFINKYHSDIILTLKNKNFNIEWTDIGSKILNSYDYINSKIKFIYGYKNNNTESIYNINWRECKNILTTKLLEFYKKYNNVIEYYDSGQDLLITVNDLYKNYYSNNYFTEYNLLSYFLNKSTNKINKIENKNVVIYSDWIKEYIAEEHYYMVECLQKQYNYLTLPLSQKHFYKFNNCKIIFITYDDYIIGDNDNDNNNMIFYRIDDIITEDKNKLLVRITNCKNSNFIFSVYAYLFNNKNIYKYYKFNKDKLFYIPYSVPGKFNCDFNLNPKNKLLISGYFDDKIIPYSFRYYMSKLAQKNDFIDILKHKGYNNNNNIKGINYINLLNSYLCCFTCCTDYKYIVLKHYEIIYSGALLLCSDKIKKELNELGFIDMKNCIFCNIKNVNEKLKYIFNPINRNEIDRIRLNGYILSKNHITEKRAEEINEIVYNL